MATTTTPTPTSTPNKLLSDQIAQLDAARNLVLGDSTFYPQIIEGILPIVGPQAHLPLRRWGTEFLAETFSSPALPAAQKVKLADGVLTMLSALLEESDDDTIVLRGVIETAASLYPLVLRHL